MPVFLIWAVVAAVAVVTVVAASAYFSKAKNKRVALLGPRRSGKTKLATTLTSGVVTNDYIHTLITDRVRGDLKMDDLALKVTIDDPGGAPSEYGEWQRIHADADLVCYVVDYNRLLSGDSEYIDLALIGAEHVQNWAGSKPTVLVLTHIDEVSVQAAHPDLVFSHPDVLRLQRKLQPRLKLAVNLLDDIDQQKVRLTVAKELAA